MRSSIQFTLLLNLCILSSSRIFEPCELGWILLNSTMVPYSDLNKWVCLMHRMSRYNSSFVSGHDTNSWNNLQYGIFQIGNRFYCADEFKSTAETNACTLNCSELIDDDLTDDIRCAQLLYRRGKYSFSHWGADSEAYCTNPNTTNLLQNCDLLQGQPPKIVTTETNVTLTILNYAQGGLRCEVNGTLPVHIEWSKNFKKIDSNDPNFAVEIETDEVKNRNLSILRIADRITQAEVATYSCEVSNLYGRDEKKYLLKITDPEIGGIEVKIAVTISVATAVIIVTICVIGYRIWFKNYDGLSRKEIKDFEDGIKTNEGTSSTPYIHENVNHEPYRKKEFEIPEAELAIDKAAVLGEGEHGIVYKGSYNENLVAIKTLKSGSGKANLSSLLVELKVMIFLRGHPNIVDVIGACTKDLRKGSVYIVLEFCPLGSLLNYLQDYRTRGRSKSCTSENEASANSETKCDSHLKPNTENREIDKRLMLSWSSQLADAMDYLSSKKVIHGDIACRNILMLNHETIKLTDFGLSRKLYDYASFIKKDEEPLPWRWLAIETLLENKFSTESDVWSFGITLWEILSFGLVPYPGQAWSLDFIHKIVGGLRMQKPLLASYSIYKLMTECWHANPEARPTFAQIRERISVELLEKPKTVPTVPQAAMSKGYVQLDIMEH